MERGNMTIKLDIDNTLAAIEWYNSIPQRIINKNLKRLFGRYKAEKLVEITGMGRATVYSWAKAEGGNRPTFESILRICRALGIGLEELIKED
jgi:transcriptional regulator with XRE-family HTH domain